MRVSDERLVELEKVATNDMSLNSGVFAYRHTSLGRDIRDLIADLREARGTLKAIYDVCSRGIVPNTYETAQLIRPLLG